MEKTTSYAGYSSPAIEILRLAENVLVIDFWSPGGNKILMLAAHSCYCEFMRGYNSIVQLAGQPTGNDLWRFWAEDSHRGNGALACLCVNQVVGSQEISADQLVYICSQLF